MTNATRILLAEDELPLRDFVSRNLQARGFEVLEASNGLEALAIWEHENPHLLILDLMMPRMDGLAVCQHVREHSSMVPIIVLTALDAEKNKVAALDLGADDYLTKPFGVEELMARVRAMLRRAKWEFVPLASGIKHFGEIEIDLAGHIVRLQGATVRLSPTEFALLEQLASNTGKVLTHRQLLQSIWGPEYGGEAEYLRVYINRLRQKLEADPANPCYILTEPGVGYRLVTPEAGTAHAYAAP
jgi:two-component system, OmpR family, KDP operon response regulator KdpE